MMSSLFLNTFIKFITFIDAHTLKHLWDGSVVPTLLPPLNGMIEGGQTCGLRGKAVWEGRGCWSPQATD